MNQQTCASRDLTSSLNDAAFGRTLREHPAIYIRASEASQWRCTRRKKGSLRGLESFGELEILLTDGVVAWFTNAEGKCIHGHVAAFVWTEPEVVTGFYFDPVSKKRKFFKSEKVGGLPGPLFGAEKASSRSEEELRATQPTGPRRNGRSSTYSLAMEMLG